MYPNQGEPSQWAQGIRTAIAERADAILLLAQNPELVGPQIRQAEAAGIPVIVLRTTARASHVRESAPPASRHRSSRPGGSRPTG